MSLYNIVAPATLVPGQPEDVSQVLANFQAIQAVLNGGIDDVNIRSTAAIVPSKLAGYPSNQALVLRGDGSWGRVQPTMTILTQAGGASGTYTTPAGCKALMVEIVGAGGGGGGSAATSAGQASGGGGGGGGGYARNIMQLPGASIAYQLGAPGAASAAGGAGNGGAQTYFQGTSFCFANGGSGGSAGTVNAAANIGSGGGAGGTGGGTGAFAVVGETGWSTQYPAAGIVIPGRGGLAPAYSSSGRQTAAQASNGTNGQNYGGGGYGGFANGASVALAGGAGADAIIIIMEYY